MNSINIPGSGMQNVIEGCGQGEEVQLDSNEDIDKLVDKLCFVNFRQWQLEDAIREPSLSAQRALELIRAIQASNSERNRLMELIDRYFVEIEVRTPEGAVETEVEFHETLGQLLDSLSILYVRKYHMERLQAQGFDHHPYGGYNIADAVSAISEQISLYERSFSRLRSLFKNGQVRLPPFSRFKLYGSPRPTA